jgi:hypothetical protein
MKNKIGTSKSMTKYQAGGTNTSTSKVPSKYPRKVPEMEGMKKPVSPMRPPARAKYGGSIKSKNK